MHYPVAYRRHRNLPPLVIGNNELLISTMMVFILIQIFIELKKISLQIVLKFVQFVRTTFALSKGEPTVPYIF